MIGNKYALDTNIISAWLDNDVEIANRMDEAEVICIPIIVIGEMYYGAQYSTLVEYNINNIEKALFNYSRLYIDEATCWYYGIIKTALRKKGKPIPENDIWIAALSLQNNLALVTRDQHFNDNDNLVIERW